MYAPVKRYHTMLKIRWFLPYKALARSETRSKELMINPINP
jgi:hypothetical protein